MANNTNIKGKYLLFESAKELLAFDTKDIEKLATTNYIHKLPHKANSCILGISNISGDICIILSLAKLLKIEDLDIFTEADLESQKLILCNNSGTKLAFLVDEIHHLSEESDTLSDEDEEFSSISSISVFKVASLQNRSKSYNILDLELLINALERNYL